jgi:hypothetical protein
MIQSTQFKLNFVACATRLSLTGVFLAVTAPALAQVPPLPTGGGWRPVNPQILAPGSTTTQFPNSTQFNLQSSLLLRSGDIVAATYRSAETLLISPGQILPYQLVLDTALQDPSGNVVLPAGSIIEGQFQPAGAGTQFVAKSLIINGQPFPLSAQSTVINNQRDPRQVSGEAIVQDALVGAAAGALLGGLLGNRVISTEKVLGGAAAGAVIGNVTAPDVAVIKPNTVLNLTVTQDFQPLLN